MIDVSLCWGILSNREAKIPLKKSIGDVGNSGKSIAPKPANMALMTEKNELENVFSKLNRHQPASANVQLEVHHNSMTDNIVLELEPEEESPKANLTGESNITIIIL